MSGDNDRLTTHNVWDRILANSVMTSNSTEFCPQFTINNRDFPSTIDKFSQSDHPDLDDNDRNNFDDEEVQAEFKKFQSATTMSSPDTKSFIKTTTPKVDISVFPDASFTEEDKFNWLYGYFKAEYPTMSKKDLLTASMTAWKALKAELPKIKKQQKTESRGVSFSNRTPPPPAPNRKIRDNNFEFNISFGPKSKNDQTRDIVISTRKSGGEWENDNRQMSYQELQTILCQLW